MLKVKVANGTVVFTTDIDFKDVAYVPVKLIDEKGNETFAVAYNAYCEGQISANAFVGNAVIDGKLALVKVLEPDETIEDVRHRLTDIFARVSSCVAAIEAQLAESKAAFESAWAGATEA